MWVPALLCKRGGGQYVYESTFRVAVGQTSPQALTEGNVPNNNRDGGSMILKVIGETRFFFKSAPDG